MHGRSLANDSILDQISRHFYIIIRYESQFCPPVSLGWSWNEWTMSYSQSHSWVRLYSNWWPPSISVRGTTHGSAMRLRASKGNGWMEYKVHLPLSSHHTASGLYEQSLKSSVTVSQAEEHIIQWLTAIGVVPGQLVIAGNSVHVDKLFLFHHMPRLNQFLHYRILDVSSLKIVVNALHP